jgi:formyl-CoA transferase
MTVNSPIWIQGQQKVEPRRAPRVGEHSDQVLHAAGYSATEIQALRAEGVIA